METAIELASENVCIFLDDFNISDIADATIIKRLFQLLVQHGVIMVVSSSKSPEELYFYGIQRPSFVPFVPFLRENNLVIEVEMEKDFRNMLIEQEKKAFSRLYYGKKFRQGDEQFFQTFFCMFEEEDADTFQ